MIYKSYGVFFFSFFFSGAEPTWLLYGKELHGDFFKLCLKIETG